MARMTKEKIPPRECYNDRCHTFFTPGSHNQLFHDKTCYKAYWARMRRGQRKRIQGLAHPDKESLECSHCQAMGDEVAFSTRTSCDACAQQIKRRGSCDKCNRPMYGQGCPGCDPPEGTLPIILLDRRYERERTIHRKPDRGCVIVGHRRFRITSIPLIISLPGFDWVKVRI